MSWSDDEFVTAPQSWDNDEPVAQDTKATAAPVKTEVKSAWDSDVPLPANHPISRAIAARTPVSASVSQSSQPVAKTQAAPERPTIDQIYFKDEAASQVLPPGASEYPDMLAKDMIALRQRGGVVTPQFVIDHGKAHGFNINPTKLQESVDYFNKYGKLPVIGTPQWEMKSLPDESPDDEAGQKADTASRGFADAATLGIAPKALALINSYKSGKPYSYELARIRQLDRADEENHPAVRIGSELAGGLMLPVGEMKSAAQVVGKSAALGAAYSGISSDAPDVGSKVLAALEGGAFGAGVGGILHGGSKAIEGLTSRTPAIPETVDPIDADAERVFNARSAEQGGTLNPEVTDTPVAPKESEPVAEGIAPPEDPEHPVNKLLNAIEEAKVARNKTDTMRRQDMKERVQAAGETGQFTSGEAGFHAEKAELAGKYKTADFNPLDHLDQNDIDGLFDTIKNHPTLSFFDSLTARQGLSKLLGATEGIPTKGELHVLGQVFPKDMVDGLSSDNSMISRIKDAVVNSLNVPRALMASMDLSAPGRQGIFLIGTKAYWKAFYPMVKAFGSKAVYNSISDEIASRPSYKLMERAGLALTNVGKKLSDREEAFMSQYAEKLPLVGKLVAASDRAYSGYLNKLRADTFDSILKDTYDLGIDVNRNPKAVRDIAKFVNAATGRGDLGSFNQAAPVLSTMFFSPRLIASRLQLLSMPLRPNTYLELNPAVRQAYFKNLFKFAGLAMTTLSLAKAAGLEVEADPRSSDFGKIKVGNTRFDILGGFQQYIRAAAQIVTGERKGADGSITKLGAGYKADTRFTVLENLIFNKLAPVPSFVKDVMSGKDAVGQQLDYNPTHLQQNPVWSRLVPLVIQDINDAYQDAGFGRAAIVAPAAIFGIGTQTYQTKGKNRGLKEGGKDDPLGSPDDPVVKEVNRLGEGKQKGLVTPPSPSIFIEGKQVRLSDDDYKRYERTAAEYIKNDLRQTMTSPEWRNMSDEERRDTIKDIVKDQRANARDAIRDTLGQTPPKPDGGIIPKAHAAEAPGWEADSPLSIYDFKDGVPTSGHRTPRGNAAVGGATHSDHLDGDGVDYTPAHGQSIIELAGQARKFFGPSAWIHPEPKKHHVHVSVKGLNAPYIGQKGIQ